MWVLLVHVPQKVLRESCVRFGSRVVASRIDIRGPDAEAHLRSRVLLYLPFFDTWGKKNERVLLIGTPSVTLEDVSAQSAQSPTRVR